VSASWRRRSVFSGSMMVLFMPPACRKHFFILCKDYTKQVLGVAKTLRVIGGVCRQQK
jgi:hypothetical protein